MLGKLIVMAACRRQEPSADNVHQTAGEGILQSDGDQRRSYFPFCFSSPAGKPGWCNSTLRYLLKRAGYALD